MIYQCNFLDAYHPNESRYLSASLRRQLHKMGRTTDVDAPAGTYSCAILNRLLIDLSWVSSHLEGNTDSRLDTHKLIEHGKAVDQSLIASRATTGNAGIGGGFIGQVADFLYSDSAANRRILDCASVPAGSGERGTCQLDRWYSGRRRQSVRCPERVGRWVSVSGHYLLYKPQKRVSRPVRWRQWRRPKRRRSAVTSQ
jgi:hypothetical protein